MTSDARRAELEAMAEAFPCATVDDVRSLVVILLHEPYNWMRALKAALERLHHA